MYAVITLDAPIVYKLRCLAWYENYIAYLAQAEGGVRVAFCKVDPTNLQATQTKYFSNEDYSVNYVKFLSYRKQQYLVVVFESRVKFFGLDGTMVGMFQYYSPSLDQQEDWFTSVTSFPEQEGKEVLVLATRGGRLFTTVANTFNFELRTSTKRNITALCTVGLSILVGEENGRLLRLTSFEEGFTKYLNLSPQKLPICIMHKYSNTQVLVGTCEGEILLIEIVNMSVLIRMHAHAGLINGIFKLNDFILTTSYDGHINKFRIIENGLVPFTPSKLARLVQGVLVVGSRPFVVCYECATLKELL